MKHIKPIEFSSIKLKKLWWPAAAKFISLNIKLDKRFYLSKHIPAICIEKRPSIFDKRKQTLVLIRHGYGINETYKRKTTPICIYPKRNEEKYEIEHQVLFDFFITGSIMKEIVLPPPQKL